MQELTEAQKKVKEWRKSNGGESNGIRNTESGSPENIVNTLIKKIDNLQKTVDEMSGTNKDPLDMSALLIGVPIIFTALVLWGGISFYFLGTLISAMVIMTEVSNAPGHRISNLSGIEWFAISSVFWFFTFPYYMMRRSRVGLSNLFAFGIVLAIVFFGSMIYTVGQSIQSLSRVFM